MIPDAEDDTETHVNYTKDDRDLHFICIKIGNLILCHHPDGVNSKWVRCLSVMAIGFVGNQHRRVVMM